VTLVSGLAWRFDALDARGGLAFASYRGPDLIGGTTLNGDLPGVFIGAPEFQPLNLLNRAVGLAAGRHAFQTGLFLGRDEVGFESLDDLVEFTRRCYLRGGAGDGAGPGGGVPPILPLGPEGGPELPSPTELPPAEAPPPTRELASREGPLSIKETISSDLTLFAKLVGDQGGSEPSTIARLARWNSIDGAGNRSAGDSRGKRDLSSYDGPDILAQGALILIQEVLRRLPIGGSEEDFFYWLKTAKSLGDAIARIGLWPFMLGEHYVTRLTSIVDIVWGALQRSPHGRIFVEQLNIAGVGEEKNTLLGLFHNGVFLFQRYYRDLDWLTYNAVLHEPLDHMQIWPVPKELSSIAGGPKPDRISVADLLAGFLGAPPTDPRDGRSVPSAIVIVVFAAACIVAAQTSAHPLLSYYPWYSHSVMLQALAERAESGQAWLAQQLPRRAFSPSLERYIKDCSGLIYA
jgi:hypothetical protein